MTRSVEQSISLERPHRDIAVYGCLCSYCESRRATASVPHQSQLAPADNKFHRGNGEDQKHYWLTPPDLYAQWDAEFHFSKFDPCPHPKPDDFDGLTCDWGEPGDWIYVNPPFGSILHEGRKKGPTFWARKSIEQSQKGRGIFFVYPIDKWVLMLLATMGSTVRNLGDVRWRSIEDLEPQS